MSKQWSIEITDFLGGLSPGYYSPQFSPNTVYPNYGNKNQAGAMLNIDNTLPDFITQGPSTTPLTNGTDLSEVTTLIKGITDYAVRSSESYAVGGNKLYGFTPSKVLASGDTGGLLTHTIDKAVVTGESGEDVCFYHGDIYYSYNHSGSAGDIGKFASFTSFTDAWASAVPSGAAALQGDTVTTPHQMIAAGDDKMYIANGRYVASYDGSTFQAQALDLPTGYVVQSIQWLNDRLYIAANSSDITAFAINKIPASIYIWDGTTSSWESEIKIMGTLGGLHVKNGVLYVFYQDVSSVAGYQLGYVSGQQIVPLTNYYGSLPAYYQITDYRDFIIWQSGSLIYGFGSGKPNLPARLFQLASPQFTTCGGLACPFGTVITASFNGGSNYRLSKFSGYETASSWDSLMFDITSDSQIPKIDKIRINFNKLATGARVDWKLVNSAGVTLYSDTISFTKLGAVTTAYYPINGKVTPDFRVEFDFSSGSNTNPVEIKQCKIYGTSA